MAVSDVACARSPEGDDSSGSAVEDSIRVCEGTELTQAYRQAILVEGIDEGSGLFLSELALTGVGFECHLLPALCGLWWPLSILPLPTYEDHILLRLWSCLGQSP